MGIRSWLGLDDDDGDRSLIEVGNDSGDHIVIEVPTKKSWQTIRALRKAGVERDGTQDPKPLRRVRDEVDNRDPNQHRYSSGRVVDEREDDEDTHDAEPERWWGGFW